MEKITAVIIEDEEYGLTNLIAKLKANCPQVEIVGTSYTASEGLRIIQQKKPDLVFLDIHLGPVNGFDLLTQLEHITFELIVTTDHENYGIDAVKANAVDYLLKPVIDEELVTAVGKVETRLKERETDIARIAIPITHGYRIVALEEILYIEANDQRTTFHLYGRKESIDSPRTLGKVYEKLQKFNFCRIHRSYVVNIDSIEQISRKDGGYVIMSDGTRLRVSQGHDCPGLLVL